MHLNMASASLLRVALFWGMSFFAHLESALSIQLRVGFTEQNRSCNLLFCVLQTVNMFYTWVT